MAGSNRATVTESEPSTAEIVASSSQTGSSFTGENGTKKKCLRGGYTCCVPGCYSNTKRDKELSFHKFPRDIATRERWKNAIKRKDFIPSEQHRVCSKHFESGTKKGLTDVPAIFPLLPQPKFRKAPKKREPLPPPPLPKRKMSIPPPKPLTEALKEEVTFFCGVVRNLHAENFKMEVEKFGLTHFAGSDADIKFYTGFPNYSTLTSFYEFLQPAVTQLNYWGSNYIEDRPFGIEKRGPSRKLKPIDELFLVLCRMRCNVLEKDLGNRFGLDCSTISRILTTWINFLYYTLKQLPIWASLKVVNETMPECFKAHYPCTRVIIDCTELFIQMPSSFRAQSQTYSTYKSHNTAKGLIGIAPSGFVTFISNLYGGHLSDKKIT